jgi:mediator of RNA polymerase II transcription subunit 14
MDQNRQFDEVMHGLRYAKDSLDSARLRNHDLLTSLDVLTTGTYRRLPSAIKARLTIHRTAYQADGHVETRHTGDTIE